MKPNFICIGAQKAGTSWLYHQLVRHPEFAMPPAKELHYFDMESPNTLIRIPLQLSSRLKDFKWLKCSLMHVLNSARRCNFKATRWYVKWHFSNYSDDWYTSLFDFANGKITGDITPSYSILDESDVARMHRIVGDAKIIFLIRNPIDRAWSMLQFGQKYGRKLALDDIEFIKRRIDSPTQELRSDYERTLAIYFRYFDSKQILIGFYDAIRDQPKNLISAILDHIGAKDINPSSATIHSRINVSETIEMPVIIRDYLTKKYRNSIESLSARFGSYATQWLRNIDGESSVQEGGFNQLSPVATIDV